MNKQNFVAAAVSGDWLELNYPCYTDGSTWNGWGNPYFTFEVAKMLALDKGMEIAYDEANDAFVWLNGDPDDEPEEKMFKAVMISVDGVEVKSYPIGCYNWCWDMVD